MYQNSQARKKLNYVSMTRYSQKISSAKIFQYPQIAYIASITL